MVIVVLEKIETSPADKDPVCGPLYSVYSFRSNMPSFRASPLLRSHLFFEDNIVFHSAPRVRFAASVEFQQFQQEMQRFMKAQAKINASFDDQTLYTITSAQLNVEFCQCMQRHAEMIRSFPLITTATRNTLRHMLEVFESNKDAMPAKIANQIFAAIQATQPLFQ